MSDEEIMLVHVVFELPKDMLDNMTQREIMHGPVRVALIAGGGQITKMLPKRLDTEYYADGLITEFIECARGEWLGDTHAMGSKFYLGEHPESNAQVPICQSCARRTGIVGLVPLYVRQDDHRWKKVTR